jgi:hypothetical protein
MLQEETPAILVVCMYVCMYVRMYDEEACMYLCMHVCMCVCMQGKVWVNLGGRDMSYTCSMNV